MKAVFFLRFEDILVDIKAETWMAFIERTDLTWNTTSYFMLARLSSYKTKEHENNITNLS